MLVFHLCFSVSYDTIFGQSVSSSGLSHSAQDHSPQWVCVFPGADLWFFPDQRSDSASHVPCIIIQLLALSTSTPLSFGFANDSVSTSSSLVARSRNSNQNHKFSRFYRRDQHKLRNAQILTSLACSLITKNSMNHNCNAAIFRLRPSQKATYCHTTFPIKLGNSS